MPTSAQRTSPPGRWSSGMPPELASWFSGFRVGAEPVLPGAPAVLEPPDHGTTLTWRVGSPDPHDIVVMGPRTRARYHLARPGRDCLQLLFRPGRAAEFLGRPLRELADHAMTADDLDSDALRALLRTPVSVLELARAQAALREPSRTPATHPEQPRTPAGFPHLLRVLAEAMPLNDSPVAPPAASPDRLRGDDGQRRRLVTAAMAMLSVREDSPARPVAVVARRLNVSERHLRTVFTDMVGVSPSRFTSIDRVRTVLAGLGRRLPDLAVSAGFYDQSHMGAEFRRVMGATPHAFTRRHWPAPEGCPTRPPA